MEVRIRLQKAGKSAKKRYNWRIVAIQRSSARESKNLEILGFYDPAKNPAAISINHEKLDRWINKGARMSNTVKSLVKKSKKSS